jgi:hypothetical protein
MRHTLQSRWQEKVFEDVLKERLYQDRQWGQDVDDKLNTPWMLRVYLRLRDQVDENSTSVDPRRHRRIFTTGWSRQVPSQQPPLRVSFARETRTARPSTKSE